MTDVKNVVVSVLLSSAALPIAHDISEFSEAGHKINNDQNIHTGGKRKGLVQVSVDGSTYAMAIAAGRAAISDWHINSVEVTPAYTSNFPAPTVGVGSDLKPNLNNTAEDPCNISSSPFPVVASTDLLDRGHVVNRREYSGKKTGSVVIADVAGVLTYAIATGGLDVSTWILADGTVLTPIGTAVPPTSVTNGNEQKPVVVGVSSVNSVDFPVVAIADLADLTYEPLYNEEQRLIAHNNHQVIADDSGTLRLMYGVYDAGVLTWYDLGDNILAVPVV